MKLRKRRLNPVWWTAIVIGCLMVSQALYAETCQAVEMGKSIIERCEAQDIVVPAAFRAVFNRLEPCKESRTDGSRIVIQQTANAFVTEAVTLDWDGTTWVKVSKDITTMNDSMTEMQSVVSQEWNGSAWANASRMIWTYNAQDQILSMAADEWRNGAWVPSMLTTNTYDGTGKLIEEVTQMDTDYDGVLENIMRMVYTYTGDNLTLLESYTWYAAWQKVSETAYTYNVQGQKIEEVSYLELYGFTTWFSKILYEYHANGKVETKTTQSYSLYTSSWTNASKQTYTYNGNGQRTSTLEQLWNGSAFDNVDLHTTEYEGPNNAMSYELWQTWNGSAWDNVDQSTYGYDGNGNQTSWLEETWNGASWENEEQGTTEYNASNLPRLTTVQEWDGSAWVNDDRIEFSYPGGTDVNDSPMNQPAFFSMSNYPNPFNPSTTIQFSLPVQDQISVTIYDATGRSVRTLIQRQTVAAGVHEVQWNGTNALNHPVASGLYFYAIQGEQFSKTQRCILLK